MHVLLFNPRSANSKHRIPNSILQVAGSIEGKYDYCIIDGNREENPERVIISIISERNVKVVGMTVMPGPQLSQAIPISKKIKEQFPDVMIVWGGYFPSNQYQVVLDSEVVDFVINGPGDEVFPKLIDRIETGDWSDLTGLPNLIYKWGNEYVKTRKEAIPDLDNLPAFPYEKLNDFYPLKDYLAKTFLGKKTLSYHSSFGCPFTCSFCAVVPIYNARWKGLPVERMVRDITYFREHYKIDAIEFHDNNFFTSRKRTVEFAEKVKEMKISWWGEGRIDTIDKYRDADLQLMSDAGLKMIFLGAETGNDEVLKQMDKGGTQSGAQIKSFAQRLRKFGIIPEMSFVLGLPADSSKAVMRQINEDIRFIKEVKKMNPETEIIIYVYSPVPTEGSDLYEKITASGFSFPKKLEDWLSPDWEKFDLRKNPLTPWLNKKHIDRIKNFETVLNAYYPTVSDFRIRGIKKFVLRFFAFWRYQTGFYSAPYELKLLLKVWKYRQPEKEGFYSE